MLAVRARALLDGRLAPSIDDVLELGRTGAETPHGADILGARRRTDHPQCDRAAQVAHRISENGPKSIATQDPIAVSCRRRQEPQACGTPTASDPGSAAGRCNDHPRPARTTPRGQWREFSGSTAISPTANRRATSIGGAPHGTTISMCASANGNHRTPFGCGSIARRQMDFNSHLTEWSKLDRALVVAFALAEVLVQGGERVGIPGLMRPTANRNIIETMARVILHDARRSSRALPPNFCARAFFGSRAAVRSVESDFGISNQR